MKRNTTDISQILPPINAKDLNEEDERTCRGIAEVHAGDR